MGTVMFTLTRLSALSYFPYFFHVHCVVIVKPVGSFTMEMDENLSVDGLVLPVVDVCDAHLEIFCFERWWRRQQLSTVFRPSGLRIRRPLSKNFARRLSYNSLQVLTLLKSPFARNSFIL
jgi:hypothetical protein